LVLASAALAAPAHALLLSWQYWPLSLQEKGVDVTAALLLDFYHLLPERRPSEGARTWATRLEEGLRQFKASVANRYTEGTLQRLADNPSARVRRAALLALHHLGTMASNEAVAQRLYDDNAQVRQMAADTLWAIWFRGDSEANTQELQRALQQSDSNKGVAVLTALIRKAPQFAEAYNQRAILHFQMEQYDKSAADCEKVLELNKEHFGAAAGLGRCYLRLQLPGPALKAFRTAYQINPNLEGVLDAIRDLETVVDEDGK
jgi:tetratricopeptide (TPR) repeat protein